MGTVEPPRSLVPVTTCAQVQHHEEHHGEGVATLYGHQSRIAAAEGQILNQGDVLGFVGTTGHSTGNHLHFEIRVDTKPRNPRPYLP